MTIRVNARLGIAALAFALLFTFVGIGVGVAAVSQPHMVSARSYLNSALGELNAATANKGGYRKSAIKLVQRAITHINLGINYANTHS